MVGQLVENPEKITSGVKKMIEKLAWPKHYGEVEKGKHWEIFFEPVSGVDDECNHKFVIVIAVSPSPQCAPKNQRVSCGRGTRRKAKLYGVGKEITPTAYFG